MVYQSLERTGPTEADQTPPISRREPLLSIIVPVKGNSNTICETVRSLLSQRFSGELEVIVVIDEEDPSSDLLRSTFEDPRLMLVHPRIPFPLEGRDSNWRRGLGLSCARGEYLALTDADMVMGPHWAQTGAGFLDQHGVECVAGVMLSTDPNSFWGSYVDENATGSKTPRYEEPFFLDTGNFGRGRTKPGVTANLFLTRDLFEEVGLPRSDFVYTYEDYAFFYDIVSAGHRVLCTAELVGSHYHRARLRDLLWEYWNSGQGCADFVKSYPDSHFAKKRMIQLGAVSVLGILGVAGLATFPTMTLVAFLTCLVVVGLYNMVKLRRLSAVAYGMVTFILGMSFTVGFILGLKRGGPPLFEGPPPKHADLLIDLSIRKPG